MAGVWGWFLSLTLLVKVAVILACVVLLLLLGPLWVILALLALPVFGVVLVVKAIRGRPLRTWGIISAGLLTLLVASCTTSALVYGGETERVAEREPDRQSDRESEADRTETTRYVTVEETVERTVEKTVAPPESDPEPDDEDETRDEDVRNVERATEPNMPPPPVPEGGDGREDVTVASVTDGDTVVISEPVEGITDVRLIGMDTPETYGGTEPYGAEASAFAEENLAGQTVRLELDEKTVDPYGRLLAYVYLPDGEMFNETLVRQGYAQVATFPPNTRYLDRFEGAQELARSEYLGIWGLPAEQLCRLADRGNGIGGGCEELPVVQPEIAPVPGVDEPPIVEQAPVEAPVSGGYPSDGYYPGAPDLDCADFPGGVTVSPGDPYGLDGDGDGVACES